MSWRDNLLQASYKDALFSVSRSDRGVGRRNIIHQFPFQEVPFVEDTGSDADEFIIEGFIVQNLNNDFDYFEERDALIDALKSEGSGTLIHPFFGEQTVSLQGKTRINETFTEGGIARFTMAFVQSGENILPEQTIDDVGDVDNVVEETINRSTDSFGALIDLDNLPDFSFNQLISDVNEYMRMNKVVLGAVKLTKFIQTAKDVVDAVASTVSTIATAPCDLGNGIINALNGFMSAAGLGNTNLADTIIGECTSTIFAAERSLDDVLNAGRAADNFIALDEAINDALSGNVKTPRNLGISLVDGILAMTRFGEKLGGDNVDADGNNIINPKGGQLSEINITTEQRARQEKNRIHVINLARIGAIANACRIAVRIDFNSIDEANRIQTNISTALNEMLLKLGDEASNSELESFNVSVQDQESYVALEKLRPVFIKAMQNIGADLTVKKDFKVPNAILSTLQLAYDEYNDLDRENEILERNTALINHPGFLPQFENLELLSI